MSEFVITFGYGHHDERNGSLANCCTRIDAPSEAEARLAITRIRGQKWANSYSKDKGEEMINLYYVREIPINKIGPQVGDNL